MDTKCLCSSLVRLSGSVELGTADSSLPAGLISHGAFQS